MYAVVLCGLAILAATVFAGFFPGDAVRGSFGQNLARRPGASAFRIAWIASLLVTLGGAAFPAPAGEGLFGTRLQLWHLGAVGTVLGSAVFFRYGDRL